MENSKSAEVLEGETSSNKGKAKQLPGDTQPRDAFIVVMGPTGSGKSTFVNNCSGMDAVVVGHGLMSETQSVAEVTFEYNGFNIHLIDTPGFDDSIRSDAEVLMMIATYFSEIYYSKKRLDGIVYISPITDTRMSGSAVRDLDIFSKLVGNEALSNVVLVTSKWDLVVDYSKVAEDRENALHENFWNPLINMGSRFCRLGPSRLMALHVLDMLLGQVPKALQIQRELVDDMKTLDQTEAGRLLSKEILKMQESFRRRLDEMKSELNDAITARDASMEKSVREEQARFERQLSQAENERIALQVDFERLLREKEDMNASLIRQIDTERREIAVLTREFQTEVEALRAQLQQNEGYRATKSPDIGEARGQVRAHRSAIQRLESELEKARKDLAEKEARMKDMRGFMLDPLIDAIGGPPPAYAQSTFFHESSEVAGRQTHSRKTPSNTSDEATKSDKFRSYLARNANQRSQQGPENTRRSKKRADRYDRIRADLRAIEDENWRKLRVELYQNSLLSREQGTDAETASNPILQRESTDVRNINTLCELYGFSIGDNQELQDLLSHTLTAMSKDTLTFRAWLFYQAYLLRNAILAVYHNCRRLQETGLAGPWFSMLVLQTPSNNRIRVINLNRVNIEDICEVVKQLSLIVTVLQDFISQHPGGLSSVSNLPRLSEKVHLLYQNIFKRLGLEDFLSHHLDWLDLVTELHSILNSQSLGESAYFVDIFAQWWCATRALDAGVVAYGSGHVFYFEETSRINLGAFKLRATPQVPEHSRSLQYIRRGLNCLAGFFQEHGVWVLAMEEASNDLYMATDIETFADVWGPVWKVADQFRPELIAKYNVRGGSIVPWPSDPDIHPELRSNERLCHWKSNVEYIHHRDADSGNIDSSASSSDLDETKEDSVQATSFSGYETLVIGAGQDARLQWYGCHCSLNAIKQDLENAGRLDRIIASKSYRYIDSRQRSLVVGSHGVQIGDASTVKTKSEVPYKVSLLDRWENEPTSRNPRKFENLWGVAVSLCTMNAERVRLVKLFGEDSVTTLLTDFEWSNSDQQKSFLNAIRSLDPFALGDLWEDNPKWRKKLGDAILICLRILFRTGYNENRDEFHMLWLPPGCRDPRRVTFRSSDQRWTKFLKDTTNSMTVAVIIEDCLGFGPCMGHRKEWLQYPSALETAICVNRNISPAEQLIPSPDTDDNYADIRRRDGGRWRRIWDVSEIKPGVQFWMRSQHRVSTIRRFNSRHLLLELDTVKREKLKEMIGLKPTEQWEGHWEYTDTELDGDGVRPIPVHIKS